MWGEGKSWCLWLEEHDKQPYSLLRVSNIYYQIMVGLWYHAARTMLCLFLLIFLSTTLTNNEDVHVRKNGYKHLINVSIMIILFCYIRNSGTVYQSELLTFIIFTRFLSLNIFDDYDFVASSTETASIYL